MAIKEYDIAGAFQAVEYELINSFFRNMKRHRVEEVKEQKQWEMWQVKQLQELDLYKKRNAKKYGTRFVDINKTVAEMIRLANEEGQMDQETEILEAMKEGLKPQRASKALTAQFFRTNERKLNALIDATTHDMEAAETAILRKANDVYRKTIFNAQVYANTGAGTYEKAVDMATKDLMAEGLTCVEYKNGARHSLPDYADMAIRTANKRAYLQGEGAKRQEWGIHTVIVNKRLKACPHCMPFAGKVFIDDVWGGGTKEDGNYPLLSTAIDAGLYHPRCRDSHTAYFPGITDRPGKYTKAEVKAAERAEEKEEKENYARRQAEKYQRLADTRMDQENRLADQHKANQWKEEAAPFIPAKTIEEARDYAQQFCEKNFMDRTFKGEITFNGICLEHANAINRSLTDVYSRFPDLEKLSGIKAIDPTSRLGKKAFPSGEDALFSYDPIQHGIYINKAVLKNPKTLDTYMQRSKESWDLVMNNMDKLSGRQRELAERYAKAGRELVNGDTVEGLFTHELGHHVQWTALDPKTTNSITERMQEYAPHLSGYATASKSEYLAESFVAYMKGENNLLDPEYVEFLDSKQVAVKANRKPKSTPEAVKGFHAVRENLVVDTLRKEYDSWIEVLSEDEKHAIRKYTKNTLKEDKKNKFYMRLNAMLRGDLPEDSYLRGYADTLSGALKKQPLQEDIICFRNIDVDPFEGAEAGTIVSGRQFFSTSVIESRAPDKKVHITIFAPKGTPGAYVEKLSRKPGQREFLIDKDVQYRIKLRKENIIVLEVIKTWKK